MFALQKLGRNPTLIAAHQIGGKKPLGQSGSRSVKHRSTGRRFLPVAGRTFIHPRTDPRRVSGSEHFMNLSWLERDILANTLRKEIVTIRLTAGDLPNLNDALEEEALAHEIARTGKPWLYVGLDQTAMNLVREVRMAAAKAAGRNSL